MEQTRDDADRVRSGALPFKKIQTKKALFTSLSFILVIAVVVFSAVSQILLVSVLPAFADSGPQPTNVQSATIGNKRVNFFVGFNPPILTGDAKQDEVVLIRLFNANTNETIKFTTFYISITKGIDPNAKPILADTFLTESGILTLKIHRQQEGAITVNASGRDPILNAYKAADANGTVNISGPILLESGFYHFRIKVMTVDTPRSLLDPDTAPVFDAYQSVAGEYAYNVRNEGSVYPITITSFSGGVKDAKFDAGSKTFSWAIPFSWNATTIENAPKTLFVHEDVKIPKSFLGIANNATTTIFDEKINGKKIPAGRMQPIVDSFSDAKSVTLHFLITKDDLLAMAKENNIDSQSMPMMITFSFSVPATAATAKVPESLTSQGAFLIIGTIMGIIMLVHRFRRFDKEDRSSHVRRFFEKK